MFKTVAEWKEHLRKIKEEPEYAQKIKDEKEEVRKQHWMELKPFTGADKVPNLPNPITEFYINKLIELGAIPQNKLENGVWYYGNYRNSDMGRWNSEKKEFDILRYKFGYIWDTCNHFENDNGYALFVPLRKANKEELKEIKKIENENL